MTSGLRRTRMPPGADREDQRGDDEVPLDGSSPGRSLRPRSSCPASPPPSWSRLPLAHQVADRDLARVLEPGAPAREHDGADRGDEQQHRGDLEGEQEVGQQQPPDLAPACRSPRASRRPPRRAPLRPVPRMAIDSSTNSAPANSALAQRRLGEPARLIGSAAAADVGDDEQVQHHHRADVDDHLGGGDELGPQQQEQRRERQQVARRARAPCRTGCAASRCRSRPRARRSQPGRRRPRPCGR